MATSSLNTTLAMAVPKKAKTKIKPTDEVTATNCISNRKTPESSAIKKAGIPITTKFPKAIHKEVTPTNRYFILLTLAA